MIMDAFKSLKDEFNIQEDIEDAEAQVADTQDKIEEITQNLADQKYNLEDKEYLKTELQDLIASDRAVLEVLKEDSINGAGPATIMAYATISKSVRENLAKLIDLEKNITDYQVTESNEDFRERVLESKERAAERRLASSKQALPNGTPGQLTQNNTYIFNGKDQFKALSDIKKEEIKVEAPNFDLS